jgi:hypothetical protein
VTAVEAGIIKRGVEASQLRTVLGFTSELTGSGRVPVRRSSYFSTRSGPRSSSAAIFVRALDRVPDRGLRLAVSPARPQVFSRS